MMNLNISDIFHDESHDRGGATRCMAEYFVERMISHLLLKSKLSPHTDAVGK